MATAKKAAKKCAPKKSKKAAAAKTLARRITTDGGRVLATYRDPLGGRWQLLASLPIDIVAPTPFQRDLSDAHVARLADAIDKLDRFLDPIVAVPAEQGQYWSPNGYHRLGAMRQLGAKLPAALETRRARAAKLLELNEHVNAAVKGLKEKGLESPYLKAFVVARINHLRFVKDKHPEFDSTIDKILGAARRFNSGNVKADQVARSGGGPSTDE